MFSVTGFDGLAGNAAAEPPAESAGAGAVEPPEPDVVAAGVVESPAAPVLPVLGEEHAVRVIAAHAATTAMPRSLRPWDVLTKCVIDDLLRNMVKEVLG